MAAQAEHFDYVSLGCGEAGKILAWTLASAHGKRCAVVEQKYIGGSCPNIACLPSKNLLNSAHIAHQTAQAAAYGLGAFVSGDVKAEMAKVKDRKVKMVAGLGEMHMGKFHTSGAELILGYGKFVGHKTIEVAGRTISAETIVINTGSRATIDVNILGLIDAKPLTHVELLDIAILPAHLIILGSGYVSIEFAQAFRQLGSKVTVIGRSSVLKNEDEDVVSELASILSRDGVEVVTGMRIVRVSGTSGHEVTVEVASKDGKNSQITGSHLLVATGRTPNTTGIGLEEHGIKLSASGHVVVDEQLRTAVPGVYAVGDCAGSPYFTHIGFDDMRVVLGAITGKPRRGGTTGRQVPSCLFTSPELAHVGLREKEANAQGIAYRLAKIPMVAILRTRTHGQTAGFAKALVEAEGDRILGFTALGSNAGEMLPVIQLAMKLGTRYQELANLVLTHPTMGEGLVTLFSSVPPRTL